MKYFYLLFALAIALSAQAQEIYTSPKLFIANAADHDTISRQELLASEGISARAGDTRFSVIGFVIRTQSNGKEISLNTSGSRFTEEMRNVIEKLPINTLLTVDAKIKGRDATTRAINMTVVIGRRKTGLFNFAAKLLKETIKLEALVNQEVILKDAKGDVLKTAITDQFGDFEFTALSMTQEYNLELKDGGQLEKGKIYLAQRNGMIIQELARGGANTFTYRLLPQEIRQMEMMEEEDPMLQLASLKNGTKNEIIVAENILYETGSSAITPEAGERLDKVVAAMKDDPSLTVELTAHTDSRGDDKQNLELSQARAKAAVEYLVSKGVGKERVSGKGAGETKILNRCGNDVQCSEEEHKLNRRTEFRFMKKK
jgi:outer membrane protein OmpA-like peptidoglycan-associated protein